MVISGNEALVADCFNHSIQGFPSQGHFIKNLHRAMVIILPVSIHILYLQKVKVDPNKLKYIPEHCTHSLEMLHN